MKHDSESIAIASVITYFTVQVSGLALAISWIACDIGFPDASDVATFAGIGFMVTAIPTLAFAAIMGGCARAFFRRHVRAWSLYVTAAIVAMTIWVAVNTILEQSLSQGLEGLSFALGLCIPPALLGAGAMHWTLWARTRRAQQAESTVPVKAAPSASSTVR